jgi:Sec-independent protein secretion pathway component TatC
VAVPLLVLYEVTVLVVRISERRIGDAREHTEPSSSY